MKTSESLHQGNYEPEGLNESTEKPESNFWGIAFMILIFVIVMAALALLLL